MKSYVHTTRRLFQRILYLLILAIPVAPALADGVVRDSVGATSAGRGGTNIAHSDNGPVLLNNPAGIINIERNQLIEFGVDALLTDLEYSDPQNRNVGTSQLMVLPQFTYIRKDATGTWAAGIGVYAPAGFGADWDMNSPLPLPGQQQYRSLGALVKILPGVAHQVTDRLSVGATMGLAVSHAEIEGPFFLQTGLLAGAPTLFDLQATGIAPSWSVGLQYQLSECTTFGLVYTGETRFRLDGDVTITAFGLPAPLGPGPLQSKFDAEVDLVWPRSLGAGFAHRLRNGHRVSVDVLWYDWSHAFDRLDMKLTNGSNPLLNAVVGPTVRDTLPLGWDDSISVRLGYEIFRSNCDVFRAGYVYNSQVVPAGTLTPFIPALLEHTVSVGYGTYMGNWRVDFAYQLAFGPETSVSRSSILGGDFDFSRIDTAAHWASVSFSR